MQNPWQTTIFKLREVLGMLRTYRLKLQPEKCEFLRKEVNYLGHQITEDGVKSDPQKMAAITSYPTPTSVKELKTFCGMMSLSQNLIFVVPSIMLYSSEISPTRCNNCVFILRNGFTLHVSGDNLTHHQEYIYCIWPQVSRLTAS